MPLLRMDNVPIVVDDIEAAMALTASWSRWPSRSAEDCVHRTGDHGTMGRKNYLIEGLSGTGKTAVCDELQRRGHHAVHGDRELAYRGDPETGEPMEGFGHEHHIWDVEKVRSLVADRSHAVTFFCGGSRNFSKFIHLFDEVFVLEVDLPTLHRRLDERPDDEWGGGVPMERELIVRWHQTKEDVPENGIVIDATEPIEHVVDEILRRCRASA